VVLDLLEEPPVLKGLQHRLPGLKTLHSLEGKEPSRVPGQCSKKRVLVKQIINDFKGIGTDTPCGVIFMAGPSTSFQALFGFQTNIAIFIGKKMKEKKAHS
jgi:hypothetical protein